MNLASLARSSTTLGCAVLIVALSASTPASAASPGAAELIDRMVAAHGGMETWASAPTVRFVDRFTPGGGEPGPATQVTVEQGARRATIDVLGTDMSMAWDGEKAWSRNWQIPAPPRFFALLNFHFLNLPWLAKDPGVILGEPGTGRLANDPTEYHTVRLTYQAGVGDTPGDYYLLFIHPETYQLAATEYIVTYKAILPEGATATPPSTLVYDRWTEAGGLKVPAHYTIYQQDGSTYASCEISGWSFSEPFDTARMTMPEDAVVDTTQP